MRESQATGAGPGTQPEHVDRRPHNLPAQPTPLIGREAELRQGRQQVLRSEVRLLTLVGPGGVGKTRLALAMAEGLLGDFEHGVWFVDLSPVADPSLVLPSVARVLGLRQSSRPVAEQLHEQLASRRLLLVLDNLEQVLNAAPGLADLLAACPEVKLLATSREPLLLRWEHVLPVPPLALPDLRRPRPPMALADSPAVALFVERARAVRPDFALAEANAQAVAEICVRLDGLPLAIELAAVRVKLLPPRAISARLGRRLDLLTAGARDAPERHRTLRQAIAWSYDLLTAQERALFRRLGVFVSGSTADTAAAVCGWGPGPDAFDGLASLVDKSLLRAEDDASGGPRYRILETVREFALERLTADGELEVVQRRHAEFCSALAERARAGMPGPEEARHLDRLEAEHGEIRAALRWYLERGQAEKALELAVNVSNLAMRGYSEEGLRWLEEALGRGGDAPAELRAAALYEAARLAWVQGDDARAWSLNEACLALRRGLGDDLGAAQVLERLAYLAQIRGDYDPAKALAGEALSIRRTLGDGPGVAHLLRGLALVAVFSGEPDRAEALGQEALAIYREVGSPQLIGLTLTILGMAARRKAEWQRSASLFAEALALRSQVAEWGGIAACLEGLAAVASDQGWPERGARLFGAADALRRARHSPLPTAERAEYAPSLASVRARLGVAAFDAAWHAGQAMPVEEAVAYALATEPHVDNTTPEASIAEPGAALSPREREVAALVAQGLTNRQIAERLVVTERTAAAHVEHILAKLGFSSRTQIGVWAAGQGLAAPGAP